MIILRWLKSPSPVPKIAPIEQLLLRISKQVRTIFAQPNSNQTCSELPLMKKIVLSVLLLLSPGLLSAELPDPALAPWYEIEIILFEHNTKKGGGKEVWGEQTITPDLVDTIELAPPDTPTVDGEISETAFQQLAPSQLQLSAIAKQLKRSSAYTPLLHLGWRQPGLGRELAPAVLIYPYPDRPANEEGNPSSTADEVDQTFKASPAIASDEWQEKSHTFGYIRLFLSRYLHIDSDLVLSKPIEIVPHHLILNDISALIHSEDEEYYFNSPDQLLTPPKTPLRQAASLDENHYFRIDENRRLRKQELHYFDHPRFGMLIVVRDYTPPIEEPKIAIEPMAELPQ